MALSAPIDMTPAQVRDTLTPLRSPVSIALYRHGNAFSVGGIIRVAHSYLVREIFLIGTEPYYEKASMGMHHYENIVQVPDDEAFLQAVATRPLWAVEKDHATVSLPHVEHFPKDVVFVFGSERFGLPPRIIQAADEVIGIPMYGINNSFPVVVTSGVVLYAWASTHFPGKLMTPSPR